MLDGSGNPIVNPPCSLTKLEWKLAGARNRQRAVWAYSLTKLELKLGPVRGRWQALHPYSLTKLEWKLVLELLHGAPP